MSEKQFDAFDERFRDAAGQYEPPFDEASWKMLEPRLDAPAPRRRRAGWWWLPDMLMIGLLLYIALHLVSPGVPNTGSKENIPNGATTSQQQDATTFPGPVQDIKETKAQSVDQLKTDGASSNSVVMHPDQPADKVQDLRGKDRVVSAHQTGTRPVAGGTANRNRRPLVASVDDNNNTGNLSPSNKGLPTTKEGTSTGKTITDPATIINNNAGSPGQLAPEYNHKAIDVPNTNLVIGAEMSIERIDSADLAIKTPGKETLSPVNEVGKKPELTKALPPQKGFYVYGMAGSEWSLVPGNDAGKATFAWGVGLGYRFSPRWALQAGYFSTRKLYDAGPGDYKPKPGTYYYNLTIKHVEADCEIAEIPISVSYSLLNTRKQTLFATLGFSSYIMNSEEYHYDYIRANQMPGYAKYRYETHDSHLFAGLLLSGGYSHTLFNGFSLSAEPYVKIPLYGVGEGSIKIYNFGLMAGARYTLPSFRKK